jgi:pyruvate,water dikinase
MICGPCTARNEKIVLSGRAAVHGCVEGCVRVILTPRDNWLLQDGEILVTPMTDPSSTPAIVRAAAIVTDRGGILCHAAIVCRELGRPCVVGTLTATTALVTGMNVRVCATRGVVTVT